MDASPSLTEDTYEQIRQELISCRLKPGQRLKTNELSERLGVSLGAVREALARLTAENLVVSERQRGFRAASMSVDDLAQLTDATVEVEAACLRRSMAVGDVEWETGVVAAYHRFKRTPIHPAGDLVSLSPEFSAAYGKFRHALVSACDNVWLLKLRDSLTLQAERYRQICMVLGPKLADDAGAYDALVAAVLARDAGPAVQLLAERLTINGGLLAARLAEMDLGAGPGL